jgi:hypothetical protein
MITKLISKTIDGTKVSGEELPKPEGFDIIGDVHGYAEELTALLKQLDYKDKRSLYPRQTQSCFCG